MGKVRKPRDIANRNGYAIFDPHERNAPFDVPWYIAIRISNVKEARKFAAWLIKSADWLEEEEK